MTLSKGKTSYNTTYQRKLRVRCSHCRYRTRNHAKSTQNGDSTLTDTRTQFIFSAHSISIFVFWAGVFIVFAFQTKKMKNEPGGYANFDDQRRKRPADSAQPGDDKPFKKRWRGETLFGRNWRGLKMVSVVFKWIYLDFDNEYWWDVDFSLKNSG